jgi:hypothetical protein
MVAANSKETAAERTERTAASPGGAAAIPKVAVKNPEGKGGRESRRGGRYS